MKKIINVYLIIYTLPACIANQTCRSHHSQVKGLISTSNLTECITPFQHSLCIFCRNCKGLARELHLTEVDSLITTVNNQVYLGTLMFFTILTNIRLTRPRTYICQDTAYAQLMLDLRNMVPRLNFDSSYQDNTVFRQMSYRFLCRYILIWCKDSIFIESKKQITHYFTAVTHFFFELSQYYMMISPSRIVFIIIVNTKHHFHPDDRWQSSRVQDPQGHHPRNLQGCRQLPPPVTPPTRSIPRPVHEEPIGGCPYTACVRVRPLPPHTSHHSSAYINHPSRQLFFTHTTGHTFPIPDEPAKTEVHQVPSHPNIV